MTNVHESDGHGPTVSNCLRTFERRERMSPCTIGTVSLHVDASRLLAAL